MKASDPNQNEVYKFLGCEQGENIDVKKMMERVKKEIKIRLKQISITDSKLKGNFPKTKENVYTGNTNIIVYPRFNIWSPSF